MYEKRLKNLREQFKKWRVEGCLIENPVDLYYLLGLELSAGALIVGKKEALLFVDGRYLQVAQEKCPVRAALSKDMDLSYLLKGKKIAFDSRATSADRYLKLKKCAKFVPVPGLLKEIRVVKDPTEQQLLKKSALLLNQGYEHIKKLLKKGVTEKQIALEFEIYCKKHGAEKLAFDSIIAFGANSAMPHYRPGDTQLKEGDIVLIDIGVSLNRYHSDMTRMIFFGKPNPELKRIYAIVQEAQAAALKKCKPGATMGQVDKAARAVMKREKVEHLFVHSLGHGIGIETHEFPRLKEGGEDSDIKLKAGMVVTVEPGLYLPGMGGARYEDMILITNNGYEKLT